MTLPNVSAFKRALQNNELRKSRKNVDYVLLAEFDIDKGSTVRHQYPKPCAVSENILADLMLPEGAHLRESDWTYFFLRDEYIPNKKRKRRMTKVDKWSDNRQCLIDDINNTSFIVQVLEFSESVSDWFIMHETSKCNFVYTGKWDITSNAIPNVTLKIAHTEESTNIICSAPVDIDLQFTVLSERDLFCSFYPPQGSAVGLKFSSLENLKHATDIVQQVTEPARKPKAELEPQSTDEDQIPKEPSEPLVVLNLVRTQKNTSVKRGAVVKAIAIATHLHILETLKPLLMLALDDYYRTESEDGLINLYNTLNAVSFNVEDHRNTKHQRIPNNSKRNFIEETFTVPIKFHGIHMPLTVPLNIGLDEITGVSMLNLFQKFQRHIPVIYNACFTQKRVIFVGHNEPSAVVCNMVFAACLLVSPAITGILYKRAFPYACLTAMQFLQIPGYIAGVTNPIFEQREVWWDVLCNITTGDVKLSENYRNELELVQATYAKTLTNDKQMIAEIKHGIQLHYGEKWLRSVFANATEHIVKMALNVEVFVNDEQQKIDCEINEWRIETWKNTESYQAQLKILEKMEMESPFKAKTRSFERIVRTIQVNAFCNKIKRCIRPLDEGLARRYFAKVDHELSSEMKIAFFVKLLTPSLGGLYPIMQYLFHNDLFISSKMLDIAIKLDESEAGKTLMGSLNFFYVVAFERLKEERAAGLRKSAQLKKGLNAYKIKGIHHNASNSVVMSRNISDVVGESKSGKRLRHASATVKNSMWDNTVPLKANLEHIDDEGVRNPSNSGSGGRLFSIV